ncbi:hypothetical protein CPAR01_06207 [Colletotrichum paranaense]|uniref:Uncharacterized protein n=4 Tax=Colletotrichum acutatum species complex TaxID=2707335 RepID=A0AAI9Z3R7_9PEZI|nr:uncharacterized protein CCOS01_02860 [Colletotrichum costaricense]XP_060351947.1 uncharacterized protein CPAR01_06207 [Colletotrichum paranaense]XP_060387122.1 uncharacterized protein CTAM01_02451 [Colletotrichum tamarilloi]KAI3552652.1 hypothetical protein CSPX01_00401 [Colletotrichum filicis]KAK1481452.1 hypothetical protein CCUS01_04565 [Colletotrichum cuscutae]KAK1508665.1 hypothetical protein CTAM01_02451 [Colletotrichum tamarilloi]KAK1534108.1 hypothetical protein CCOS01_02860 [Colle
MVVEAICPCRETNEEKGQVYGVRRTWSFQPHSQHALDENTQFRNMRDVPRDSGTATQHLSGRPCHIGAASWTVAGARWAGEGLEVTCIFPPSSRRVVCEDPWSG